MSDTASSTLSSVGDVYSSMPIVFIALIALLCTSALLIYNEKVEEVDNK